MIVSALGEAGEASGGVGHIRLKQRLENDFSMETDKERQRKEELVVFISNSPSSWLAYLLWTIFFSTRLARLARPIALINPTTDREEETICNS